MWGASFLFIKVAVGEMSPLMLVAIRLLLASVVLTLLQRVPGTFTQARAAAPPLRSMWRAYLYMAFINAIVPYTFIAWGEQYTASGTASILNATTPLFVAVLVAMGLGRGAGERLTLRHAAGVLLGFLGVGVLVAGSDSQLGAGGGMAVLGQLAVLVASLSYALSGLYARRRFAGVPPIFPATWQNIAGAAVLLPAAWILTPLRSVPSWHALGSVTALGVLGTGIALVLYYELIARIGAARTTMVTYLLPVMALIYGALLLHERVGWFSIAGLVLVLVGVGLTLGMPTGRLRRFNRNRAPQPSVRE